MIVGIVGSEAVKFTPETERLAKREIRLILSWSNVVGYSSGHCHLGGVDIWTEEIGNGLGLKPYVYSPYILSWEGYKRRNIEIAKTSDELHCITVKKLPDGYTGMKFPYCYHCKTNDHIKSGGCWTLKYAEKLGKKVFWHIIGE